MIKETKKIIESKKILLLGSRKFYDKIENIVKTLKASNIDAFTTGKPQGELTAEQELEAKLSYWHRVKSADIIYMYTPEGYVGEDGLEQIGYAYTCSKEMITSEEISKEIPNYKFNRELVSRVFNLEELIKYCKNGNNR
jgi:hypothetical protein